MNIDPGFHVYILDNLEERKHQVMTHASGIQIAA